MPTSKPGISEPRSSVRQRIVGRARLFVTIAPGTRGHRRVAASAARPAAHSHAGHCADDRGGPAGRPAGTPARRHRLDLLRRTRPSAGQVGEPCRRLSSVVLVLRYRRTSPGRRRRGEPRSAVRPVRGGAAERRLKVLLRTLAVAPVNMAGAAQVLDFSASGPVPARYQAKDDESPGRPNALRSAR